MLRFALKILALFTLRETEDCTLLKILCEVREVEHFRSRCLKNLQQSLAANVERRQSFPGWIAENHYPFERRKSVNLA